jgi:hypothetical protein
MMGKLLSQSVAATGKSLSLDSLNLHSMIIDHDDLMVDMDDGMTVK